MVSFDDFEFKNTYTIVKLIKPENKTDSGIILAGMTTSARFIEFGIVESGENKGKEVIFNKSTSKPFQYPGFDSDDYFVCKDTDIVAIKK